MVYQTLLIAFAFCFLLEFLAFGMQRATLLVSREADVPAKIGALLLPSWFPIVWLVRICKWGILITIVFLWSWSVAIGLLVANVILSSILPIPYGIYIPFFRERILQIKQIDIEASTALEEILNTSKIHRS
ncbi:MAG: hypothetical protein ABTQ25_03660 [Nitrosomonas ureae]